MATFWVDSNTTFNTGDSITVPAWNGRNIQNILVDADSFIITKRFGDEITGVVYLVDECKVKDDVYSLLQSITLEEVTDEAGTYEINRYKLYVGKNGAPCTTMPGAINEEWAEYETDWFIPGVDRLLVGRLKSHAVDPANLNPAKGVPICIGAKKPIAELHYLWDQFHVEFELSEKFVAADKTLFEVKTKKSGTDEDGSTFKRGLRLPRGRNRVLLEANGGRAVDGQPFMKEWSPDIRVEAYDTAIQMQFRRFEACVGVSDGIVSRIEQSNYENVDNVRKSMRKTQSFIDTSRKMAEQYLENLVYAWNVLANYYEITPPGEHEIQFNWSDEYIDTFNDRMNGLIQGQAVGAVDAADIRAYLFGEAPEVAAEKVAEIAGQPVEAEIEAVGGGNATVR